MMDKSCHSSGEESSAINPNLDSSTGIISGKDQYLKHLHKLSHKISKPPIRKPFEFDHQPPVILDESQPSNLHHHHHQQQQHQPPVYNVSKSDFRDVVQKLTGSPAHERVTNPVQPVKPQSSRLQRIRPPPLEHVGNRPPPNAVAGGVLPQNPSFRQGHVSGNFFNNQRPQQQHHQPLSPLPPLPAVHATAESPISAYMRCFQTNGTSISGPSPRWNSFTPPPPPPPPLNTTVQPRSPTAAATDIPAPSSPLPFGCLHSPKSQYPMLSPGFPFSPTNQFGFQQLTPLSPTPPAPSPRWKSL
ncbi:VQ motif-containing protein 9 [Cynara cardunculus var. scolymus]|uniref:VQ-like protein n=1 Tax=Cynara cardunculus var. scolymus TaxID=59895 RepID=A0A118JZG3_CYNCS|nr:VQ motif-containing protein 9 [Cynara cardunculus var. scolymus]KVH99732.1 VQ-like protein [Cynara cardunculus var. scolymus]